MSVAYKWLGGKVIVEALDTQSERSLLKKVHKVLSSCSLAIAHNGDKFDFKKLNTRFLHFDMKPPPPFKTIDTRKVARQKFGFYSNSLDDLAKELKLGEKVHHEGFNLWKKCMRGERLALRLMKKYNANDVELLEKIYLRFRPWIDKAIGTHHGVSCPKCSSKNLQSRGLTRSSTMSYRRYQCNDCGGWSRSMIGARVSTVC